MVSTTRVEENDSSITLVVLVPISDNRDRSIAIDGQDYIQTTKCVTPRL